MKSDDDDDDSRQIFELDSTQNNAEPVNKLAKKMRNLSVKRPKCRSKLALMLIFAGIVLLVLGVFIVSGESSSSDDTDDAKIYGGELSVRFR